MQPASGSQSGCNIRQAAQALMLVVAVRWPHRCCYCCRRPCGRSHSQALLCSCCWPPSLRKVSGRPYQQRRHCRCCCRCFSRHSCCCTRCCCRHSCHLRSLHGKRSCRVPLWMTRHLPAQCQQHCWASRGLRRPRCCCAAAHWAGCVPATTAAARAAGIACAVHRRHSAATAGGAEGGCAGPERAVCWYLRLAGYQRTPLAAAAGRYEAAAIAAAAGTCAAAPILCCFEQPQVPPPGTAGRAGALFAFKGSQRLQLGALLAEAQGACGCRDRLAPCVLLCNTGGREETVGLANFLEGL